MKILVAEDTRDLNRALEVILEQSGYEVTCVFDGREALDRALSQSFDGIILDIMMPKMDGLEALREMRGRGIVAPVLLRRRPRGTIAWLALTPGLTTIFPSPSR